MSRSPQAAPQTASESERIIALYERHADAWTSERLAEAFYERAWLDRFSACIAPGGSVLDIGCGAGQPIAKYLTQGGFQITGIDSSPAMAAKFQTSLPAAQVHISDMRSLALKQRFEAILAWDSLFHLTPEDQRKMFPIFQAHAAPGAALMFTSGPRHGEVMGTLSGEPLYHASLDPAEYRTRLAEAGFAIIANIAEDKTCGGRTIWLAQRG